MATELELRNRIRSVKNIAKVTNALSAVSASKARRAEGQVKATRVYATKAFEILNNLAAQAGEHDHPLLTSRSEIKHTGLIVITGDRGLAGAYNSNIIRLAENFIRALPTPTLVITVGRKGRDLMIRRGYQVVATFMNLPSPPALLDIVPVAKVVTEDFLAGKYDQVFIAYTDYINLAKQRPVVKQLLPLKRLDMGGMAAAEYVRSVNVGEASDRVYSYEPDPAELLNIIVPRFTELQLFQSVLEALASEESARFMAMQNATDNASALVEALTLERNKARQSNITSEILDIVGGAEALAKD